MALPATEDFTGTDNAQVSSLPNWANVYQNGCDIQSNQAQIDAGTDNEGADRWISDSFDNDQYSQATVSALAYDRYIGVAVRCQAAASSYYIFYTDYEQYTYMGKVINGSWSDLGSSGAALSVSDVIRIEAEGTTITPKKNGTTHSPPGAQTDPDLSAGYAGIGGYDDGASRIDNWEGGNLAAGLSIPVAMATFRRRRIT